MRYKQTGGTKVKNEIEKWHVGKSGKKVYIFSEKRNIVDAGAINIEDAYLVSAAPELFELLKKMESAGVFKGAWSVYVAEVLAKAEGK